MDMRRWGWLWAMGAAVCAGASAPSEVSNPNRIDAEDKMVDLVTKAAHVTPSPRQLAWQEIEFAAFTHFGMNTFTDREWGEGTEDPKLFNPTAFDANQWVQVCKDAGMRLLILTAKHHDGFCLWPSQYTEHCVKNSPWKDGKGDVVREVSNACRAGGIKFGFYVSPWDRHEKTYGDSPAYNEHFKNQLRELLTNYGEIADVWFDGACGEGPNGKRQEYDWPAYYALIRELQPKATISICGPDVRWCGNEAGDTRESEWSVVPKGCDAMQPDLGSRDALKKAAEKGAELIWHPAQVDTSIRPGWFYHAKEDDKVKSLSHLLDVYYGSVGGNAQLLLNLPPDRRGLIHENDAARMRELGQVLKATFAEDLAAGAKATPSAVRGNDAAFGADKTIDGDKNTYWTTDEGVTAASIEYELRTPRTFNRAMLQEYTPQGQRIEEWTVEAWEGGDWKPVAHGTTVGYKRLARFEPVTAQRVRVRIVQSRICPTLSAFGLFYEPAILATPVITRDAQGLVSITAQPNVEIRYWVDAAAASDSSSKRYEAPFALQAGGVLAALPIPPDDSRMVAVAGTLARAQFDATGPPPGAPKSRDKKAGWETMQPDLAKEAVQRVTDAHPLSDQQNKGGWELYEPMTDEFNGAELDPCKWWPCNPGWKGRQPGWFSPDNVVVRDGKLQLSMRLEEPPDMPKQEGHHTYTSAAVRSKHTVRYGYFEVMARPMRSAGSSSFWFYDSTPEWWTEIDVFELSHAPEWARRVNMTVHVMHTPVTKEHFQVGDRWTAPIDLADDYHVYGLEWDEIELKFYFDGALIRRGPNTDWHQPLTLNFDSETMPEWFGLPKHEDLPSTYCIEYMRAWKHKAP